MIYSLQSTWNHLHAAQEQHQTARQGDWICIKCNNLNFSFRKKCNRCKLQTRQQNDQQIRQVYHYYQQYYQRFDQHQSKKPPTLDSSEHQDQNHVTNCQCEPLNSSEEAYDGSFQDIELPSVSPIVKRYKKQKNSPKTSISQGWSSDDEGSEGREYLQQYCWQNIMNDDDPQNEMIVRQGYDCWDLEIERLFESIII